MCCLFFLFFSCFFYLPIIYDIHIPKPVGALWLWTSFDLASRQVRPSLLGTTPSLHCSIYGGDQPRTNQVHSNWGRRGVSAPRSPDTHLPSIRKVSKAIRRTGRATVTPILWLGLPQRPYKRFSYMGFTQFLILIF